MNLSILYLDDALVAINKPSGLLVHRTNIDRHETHFLVQLLHAQLGTPVFPIHRLDKPTSGVILFALDREVAGILAEQWRLQQVNKKYLAIVRGWFPGELSLNKALVPPEDKYAPHKTPKPAQDACTHFRSIAHIELPVLIDKYPQSRYSLVECRPETGRKHQIRRHLKHLAHPIIGDARYGKGRHSRYFKEHLEAPRLLLHASELSFQHPSGQHLTLQAPLDSCWQQLIKRFHWQSAVNELLPSAFTPTDPSLDYFLNVNNDDNINDEF